jgi:serine/threonine protein kinase
MLHDKKLIVPSFDETNWSGRGQHVEFDSKDIDAVNSLLVPHGILGHSATAVVEKVRCKRIMLARKKIRCNWRLKREDAIEEVAHLQRLSHAHIIRGVGTYVMGKELSILLYPATEYSLESFLDEFAELSPRGEYADLSLRALLPQEHDERYWMQEGLREFPTCIVHAVYFIHERFVKHMDIKPANLLVQKKAGPRLTSYKIYLADFGIARSYDTAAAAETESRTPFSRTYAAPEVIRQDVRGFPADIFSMGCVLFELYAALAERRVYFLTLRHQNPDGDVSYQANLDMLLEQTHLLQKEGHMELPTFSSQDGLRHSILDTMHPSPRSRPEARKLVLCTDTFRPNSCCTAGSEPFEAGTPSGPKQSSLEVVQE